MSVIKKLTEEFENKKPYKKDIDERIEKYKIEILKCNDVVALQILNIKSFEENIMLRHAVIALQSELKRRDNE